MVFVPIPFFYSIYTKKEDARDVPNIQRKMSAFVLIGTTVVLSIIQFFVQPKLFDLYSSLKTPLPLFTQLSPYVSGALAIIALIAAVYLLSAKPDYSKVDAVANKYKDGEMIKTRELADYRYQWIPIIVVFIAVGYMVLSIILPIYSLTASIE